MASYQNHESIQASGQTATRMDKPYVKDKPALQRLPGGYNVFQASRLEVNLTTKTGEVVAGPRIENNGFEGNLIFGFIATYEPSPKDSDKASYLCVDTTSGDDSKGMESVLWREALMLKRVRDPRLFAPEDVGEQY